MSIYDLAIKVFEKLIYNPFMRKGEARRMKSRLATSSLLGKDIEHVDVPPAVAGRTVTKLGILYCEETSYNMIHSMYRAFASDKRFDTTIILQGKPWGNNYHAMVEQLSSRGINEYKYDFDVTDCEFDLIIVSFIECPLTKDIRKIIDRAGLVVATPDGVINYSRNGIPESCLEDYKIKALFIEKSLYEFNKNKGNAEWITTGNPKFDYVYEVCNRDGADIPKKFEKLRNNGVKRIVSYMTDHYSELRVVSPDVSFDLYAKGIFEYFRVHRDMGLIFRPFRSYIEELILRGVWTREQVETIRRYCDDSDNIVWDDEAEYGTAVKLADAILVDVGCGIICEMLPTGKPIGIPLRFDTNCHSRISLNREIVENSYLIRSERAMTDFLDMVKRGEDPQKERRMATSAKYVTNYDGKNAERVKEIIIDRFLKR